MKKILLVFASLNILLACSKVPVTGRKQLDILPDNMVQEMAFQQYNEFIQTNQLSGNQSQVAMVKKVGGDIQRAVEKFMYLEGLQKQIKDYKWEFNLVEDKSINAWAMPGGKVVVYTGILPVAQNEAGLAVVLGHEVAHAIAKHGNERMSQALSAQLGGMALSVALRDKPEQTRALFMGAYGAGATVGVLLPFSRLQEAEADRLGLIFMAMAGYDPRTALEFWPRMNEAAGGGGSTPDFLSTHPGYDKRVENIKKYLPEAMKYYDPSVSKQ
ncbi:MAG TPA: M48 family metallopeptidase [Cytophagaceae bacterium]